jgi:hypothetical protein
MIKLRRINIFLIKVGHNEYWREQFLNPWCRGLINIEAIIIKTRGHWYWVSPYQVVVVEIIVKYYSLTEYHQKADWREVESLTWFHA